MVVLQNTCISWGLCQWIKRGWGVLPCFEMEDGHGHIELVPNALGAPCPQPATTWSHKILANAISPLTWQALSVWPICAMACVALLSAKWHWAGWHRRDALVASRWGAQPAVSHRDPRAVGGAAQGAGQAAEGAGGAAAARVPPGGRALRRPARHPGPHAGERGDHGEPGTGEGL